MTSHLPSPENETRGNRILELSMDFEVCARKAIEYLLNRPTLLSKTFRLQTRHAAKPGLRCSVEGGNGEYSAVVSLGISKDGMESLFADEKETELGPDAVGEIVNIMAGSLFGSPNFRSRYGWMRASLPSFGPVSAGREGSQKLRGVLLVGTVALILDLAIDPKVEGG